MLREFIYDLRRHGWYAAFYNAGFRILHRHDDHVRVWHTGEHCMGCDDPCARCRTKVP